MLSTYRQHFLGNWASISQGKQPAVQIGWHMGFIKTMALTGSRVFRKKLGDRNLVSLFNEILDHNSCRFLRQLHIEELFFEYDRRMFLNAVKRLADRIDNLPVLHTLKLQTIDVSQEPFPINRSNLNLFAKLKKLSLAGRFSFLVRPHLPQLQALRIDINANDTKLFESFRHSDWSSLRSLAFHFGYDDSQKFFVSRFMQPVFNAETLPRLTRLRLINFPSVRALVAQLTVSKLFPKLQELELSFDSVTDSEAQALVLHKQAFSRLQKFTVSCQYLGEKEAELLQHHIPGIELYKQGLKLSATNPI